MSDEHILERVQQIEADVHALYRLAAMRDGDQIRETIKATFEHDPRACLIFRGVQRDMTGPQIADALASRGIAQASKQRVSETLKKLDKLGFVTKTEKGHYAAASGLQGFGLDRTVTAALKRADVDDFR